MQDQHRHQDKDKSEPFLKWFAALYERGAARFIQGAICLDDSGAKRFAIGVARDGRPVLGAQDPDLDVLTDISWRRAIAVPRFRLRDWLGLVTDDITGGINPTPMKVWIPIDPGTFDAWKATPRRIYLTEIVVKKGRPHAVDHEDPTAIIPLKFRYPPTPGSAAADQ